MSDNYVGRSPGFAPYLQDREPVMNQIINGDFNVWQRGNSFVGAAAGIYSADRWRYDKAGPVVQDISRSADVPTVAQAGRLLNYSVYLKCTTVNAAPAASDNCYYEHRIEGYNWLALAQRPALVTFWVKAAKPGVYCVALFNNVDRGCPVEYTVNSANAWEQKTLTFPASPSDGTWNYLNGIGVRLMFMLIAGASYRGANAQWQANGAGPILATANQVNGCDNVANDFRITGVEMRPSGSRFVLVRDFAAEVAACQRYYEKSFALDTKPANNIGDYTGSFTFNQTAGPGVGTNVQINFKMRKRIAPVVTLYNPNAANGNYRNQSVGADCGAPALVFNSETSVMHSMNTAAGSAVGHMNTVNYTADAEL